MLRLITEDAAAVIANLIANLQPMCIIGLLLLCVNIIVHVIIFTTVLDHRCKSNSTVRMTLG